jgi:hypothetical protein
MIEARRNLAGREPWPGTKGIPALESRGPAGATVRTTPWENE